MKRILIFGSAMALAWAALPLAAQTSLLGGKTVEMTLSEYLKAVADSNLGYAAQRYNVSIAEAQLAEARVFLPNPQAQLGYSGDITRHRPSEDRESAVTSGGISQTIELGGKRGDRVEAARHTLLAASATLDDFWRNLRASAASAFVTARADQMIAARMKKSADSFDRVVAATAKRLKEGDVGEVDAIQARVDAFQFRSQYLSAEGNAQTSIIALSQFLGRDQADMTVQPKADFEEPSPSYDLSALTAAALQKRPDVIAARETHDAAAAAVKLAKAGRIPDPNVGLTYTRTGESNNPVAPYPATDTLGVDLSFELPVFTHHQPELDAARANERQADRQYDAALLNAQVEVRQAFAAYQLAAQQVAQYRDNGALRDAETVLKARTFSYEHGDASLLDLLQAQRDLNDVYNNYYGALSGWVLARFALEQAAGIADHDL